MFSCPGAFGHGLTCSTSSVRDIKWIANVVVAYLLKRTVNAIWCQQLIVCYISELCGVFSCLPLYKDVVINLMDTKVTVPPMISLTCFPILFLPCISLFILCKSQYILMIIIKDNYTKTATGTFNKPEKRKGQFYF